MFFKRGQKCSSTQLLSAGSACVECCKAERTDGHGRPTRWKQLENPDQGHTDSFSYELNTYYYHIT